MRDAEGRRAPPPRLSVKSAGPGLGGPPQSWVVRRGLGAMARDALGWATELRRRWEDSRLVVAPIASLRDGAVGRVVGRVRVVTPAHTPWDEPCAAYVSRDVTVDHVGREATPRRRTTTRRGAGVFVVRDPSGAAVVDDDYVILLGPDGLALQGVGAIVVAEGDLVEVLGVARRTRNPHVGAVGSGYREPAAAIVLDGSADRPLRVRRVDGPRAGGTSGSP